MRVVRGCGSVRWVACRIANLLGRVAEERITESEVQRLERPSFHDRFARESTDDEEMIRCSELALI